METKFRRGRLNSWNEDKGFGFIDLEHGNGKIFIHISALKRMPRRPKVGDVINYQVHTDKDGKNRAVNAKIEGVAEIPMRLKRRNIKNHNGLSKLFTFALLFLVGFASYNRILEKNKSLVTTPSSIPEYHLTEEKQQDFKCTGKVYCSQMTSCEEATFYQDHCPSTKMDGDSDGIPCENQWCN
jgi:cold shock CspA family protein